MSRKQIIPSVARFTADVAKQAAEKNALCSSLNCRYEKNLVEKLSALTDAMDEQTALLEKDVAELKNISDVKAQSEYVRDNILKDMEIIRKSADEAEVLTDAEYWPFPAYDELLFGVR